MIKVKKICFDFRLEFRAYFFIPHVCVHDSNSVLNLLFFTVKLLNYSPNLIETVCIDKTTNELDGNRVWNFILVLRCDIPITDRNHGCGSPINRVRILSDPISLRNRFLIKFNRNRPTTLKTVVKNSTLFTQIITDVKKSTCNDIA